MLYKINIGISINRYANELSLFSLKNDKQLYQKLPGLCVNIGSGGFYQPNWLCYDYPAQSKYYIDLQGEPYTDFFPLDLCEYNFRIPLSDDSVSLIYCSHTLEHVTESALSRFLSEAYRIMKKGAICRIVLPNTYQWLEDLKYLYDRYPYRDSTLAQATKIAYHVFSPSKYLDSKTLQELLIEASFSGNKFMYSVIKRISGAQNFDSQHPEHHLNYIDINKLSQRATLVGFTNIYPKLRNISSSSVFENEHIFDLTEPSSSIYIELEK